MKKCVKLIAYESIILGTNVQEMQFRILDSNVKSVQVNSLQQTIDCYSRAKLLQPWVKDWNYFDRVEV